MSKSKRVLQFWRQISQPRSAQDSNNKFGHALANVAMLSGPSTGIRTRRLSSLIPSLSYRRCSATALFTKLEGIKAERVHALENRGSHPDLTHRAVREKDMTNRNFVAFLMSSTSVENTPKPVPSAALLPR
jgi:hypothetical protein